MFNGYTYRSITTWDKNKRKMSSVQSHPPGPTPVYLFILFILFIRTQL